MDLSDLGAFVADAAPLLGKLLPIPGAGIAGELIAAKFGTKNEPAAIAEAIKADPNAAMKLAEIESNNRTALEGQVIAAETKRLGEINATMRTEANSDKWWVSGWRPFWGFISAIAFAILVGFVCFLAYKAIMGGKPEAMVMIPQLIGAFAALFGIPGAILGVASWHRGKEKRIKAGEIPAPGLIQRLTGK